MECNSEDPAVKEEVMNKVMKIVEKDKLLPPETTGGIFPPVIVVCSLRAVLP